jgi:hypothetical protein
MLCWNRKLDCERAALCCRVLCGLGVRVSPHRALGAPSPQYTWWRPRYDQKTLIRACASSPEISRGGHVILPTPTGVSALATQTTAHVARAGGCTGCILATAGALHATAGSQEGLSTRPSTRAPQMLQGCCWALEVVMAGVGGVGGVGSGAEWGVG